MQNYPIKPPQPVETGRGVSILWQNRYLYSKYDPISAAIKIADQTPKTKQTLYLIPSPLFCYAIPQLLAELDSFSVVFCLEWIEALYSFSNEGFQKLLIQSDLAKKWNQEDRLLFKRGSASLYQEINGLIERFRLRKITPVYLNGANYFAQAQYDQTIQEITQSISLFWKNKSTQNSLSMLWYRNLFRNLLFLKDDPNSITVWKNFNPQRKPFFVLGAGESLEEAIPYLKANRHQFYLLAVDTALPALTEADLPPDAIVALEAQNSNLQDILVEQCHREKILLLADLICDPCLLHYFPQKILFSSQFDSHHLTKNNTLLSRLYRHFPHLLTIPPLGSVGNSALYLAHFFTLHWNLKNENIINEKIKEIPFSAGLDFCYQRGKSHAKGSCYHKKKLTRTTRLKEIESPFSTIFQENTVPYDFPLSASNRFRALPKYTTPALAEYQKNAKRISAFFQDFSIKEHHPFFDEEKNGLDHEKMNQFLLEEKKNLERGYHDPLFLEKELKKGGCLFYLKESYFSGSRDEESGSPLLKINIARLLQLFKEK